MINFFKSIFLKPKKPKWRGNVYTINGLINKTNSLNCNPDISEIRMIIVTEKITYVTNTIEIKKDNNGDTVIYTEF